MKKITKVQQEHFMKLVDEKKARFICAWALCRRELSVSVDKGTSSFIVLNDKDEEDNESSARAFYETGG